MDMILLTAGLPVKNLRSLESRNLLQSGHIDIDIEPLLLPVSSTLPSLCINTKHTHFLPCPAFVSTTGREKKQMKLLFISQLPPVIASQP